MSDRDVSDLSDLEVICAADKLNQLADKLAAQRAEIERLRADLEEAQAGEVAALRALVDSSEHETRLRAALEELARTDCPGCGCFIVARAALRPAEEGEK